MKLNPLYRLHFHYTDEWGVELTGDGGVQEQHFFFAEGRCEGRISGRFRGANAPQRRTDGTFVPNFHGVIETDDGAIIMVETHGYGRAYPEAARQILVTSTHLSDHPTYTWLNDSIAVGEGVVRVTPNGVDLITEVYEAEWEGDRL